MMGKLYKLLIICGLTITPICVILFTLLSINSKLSALPCIIYICAIIIILTVLIYKNYNYLRIKLGLFTVYQRITPPRSRNRLHEYPNQLNRYTIAFVGDSVTFGYDDYRNGAQLERPWSKEVSRMLGATVVNCGVSSSSLLSIDKWTPIAWVNKLNLIPIKADIVGVMIGINDCYRNYPLGMKGDNTSNTFYGGLYVFYKGLKERFRPENNKDIFVIIYPHYDAKDDFLNYKDAMYYTAQLFSIPVCDLSLVVGISPYNDTNYEYWAKYNDNDFHSPHPTQIASDLYAKSIANFIKSHFELK